MQEQAHSELEKQLQVLVLDMTHGWEFSDGHFKKSLWLIR
jgi:hypothetical protein